MLKPYEPWDSWWRGATEGLTRVYHPTPHCIYDPEPDCIYDPEPEVANDPADVAYIQELSAAIDELQQEAEAKLAKADKLRRRVDKLELEAESLAERVNGLEDELTQVIKSLPDPSQF